MSLSFSFSSVNDSPSHVRYWLLDISNIAPSDTWRVFERFHLLFFHENYGLDDACI